MWTDKLQAQQPAPSPAPAAVAPKSGTIVISPDTEPAPSPSWTDKLRFFSGRAADKQEDAAPKTADVKPGARETLSTRNLKHRIENVCAKEAAVSQVAMRPNGHLLIAVKVHTEAQVEKVTGKIYAIPELAPYQLDLEATIETVSPSNQK